MIKLYARLVTLVAGRLPEGLTLFFVRMVLAGIFWRSGRTKIEEGTLLTISDTTRFLFSEEYAGVPLPPDVAAQMATMAEFFLPILIVAGLLTRLSALALIGMTLVIQIFVYPEAWWQVHSLWVALALILVVRGGGLFSLDALANRFRGKSATGPAA